MNKEPFTLQIKTREGIIFNEPILSLTCVNDTGKFDVLAKHSNFISLIQNDLSITRQDGSVRSFSFFAGLLQIINNQANIFLGFKK